MHAPRISVVIPNYWDGTTVRETLESIRESEEVEVVVVDDASPDPATERDLQQLVSDGLIDTLLVREENGGTSAALNDGIAASVGRYVFLHGNDDLLIPGILGRLADALDADDDFAFASGGYRCFGARSDRHVPPPWDPWSVLYRNLWSGSLMIRRSSLEAIGEISTRTAFPDWHLYLAFAEHDMAGYVTPDVTYAYRVHDASRLWASTRRRWKREYAVLREIHGPLFEREAELRRASAVGVMRRAWLRWTARILSIVPGVIAEAIFIVVQGFDRFRRPSVSGTGV